MIVLITLHFSAPASWDSRTVSWGRSEVQAGSGTALTVFFYVALSKGHKDLLSVSSVWVKAR